MRGMADGDRKDLDRLVIRMGGRDYVAAHLVKAAPFVLAGVGGLIYAALAGPPAWVALVGVGLIAVGVATALGH